MMKKLIVAVTILFLAMDCSTLKAQNIEVAIGGDVAKPYQLTKSILDGMKQIIVKVKSNDGREHEYKGVSLYDILSKAEAIPNNQLRGKSLTKYILVTAADDYKIVLAFPEIDPGFTDKIVLLATSMDGDPLPANLGPFRLIVTGDKRPARSAMRVTNIDVLTAK